MTVNSETSLRQAFHDLRVAAVEPLTDDSVAVTFDVPEDLAAVFSFHAGQSLTLRRIVDGVEERRTYSICAPTGSRPRIGVREIPEGLFSSWLVRDVGAGATLEVAPPSGSFSIRNDTSGRHLCIAAGSGITPMLAIAATVLRDPDAEVTLLYGNRTTSSVMFAEELADLKNAYAQRFNLIHVLSREPRDVDLFSGRLDAERFRALFTQLIPLSTVDHVWICGPLGMLTDARNVLAEFGFPASQIHFELFYVDEPPPSIHRTDSSGNDLTSELTVILNGRSTTGTANSDENVLEAVQRVRPDVPFACKGGICGTCRAVVRSGTVEMARNYALEADELASHMVLTCQSHCTSPEVTVDFDV